MTSKPLPRGTIWITGASSGIGWSTAELMARRGWIVAASARNEKLLDQLAERHENIQPYPLDVTHPAQREEVYEQIRTELGPLDVLVNNAGAGVRAAFEDIDLTDLRALYDLNIFAPIALTQMVLPEMRGRRTGRIIMVSSVVGKVTFPLNGSYSSSKYALEALTDALRVEVAPWDVQVSLIEPGPIATRFGKVAKDASREQTTDPDSDYADYYEYYFTRHPIKPKSYWSPRTCAHAIRHAAESPKPKTRYPVHPIATWVPLLKNLLPDRVFDRILAHRFGFSGQAPWK